MLRSFLCANSLFLALVGPCFAVEPATNSTSAESSAKTRTFRFIYAGAIDKLAPGAKARVWLPVPSNSAGQAILEHNETLPAPFELTLEKKFGNRTLYFETTANRVMFSVGRDLQLTPPPAAETVSFHVYPYVEVACKPHSSFVKKFRYEDRE